MAVLQYDIPRTLTNIIYEHVKQLLDTCYFFDRIDLMSFSTCIFANTVTMMNTPLGGIRT